MTVDKWPDGFTLRTRAQYNELIDGDADARMELSKLCRALGFPIKQYMRWNFEQKIEKILEAQQKLAPDFDVEAGGGEVKAKPKPPEVTNGKGSHTKEEIEKAADAVEATKVAAKSEPKPEPPAENVSDVDVPSQVNIAQAVTDAQKPLLQSLEVLAKHVKDLYGELSELRKENQALRAVVDEIHFGYSVLVLGDEHLQANIADPAIKDEFFGKSLFAGESETGDDTQQEAVAGNA